MVYAKALERYVERLAERYHLTYELRDYGTGIFVRFESKEGFSCDYIHKSDDHFCVCRRLTQRAERATRSPFDFEDYLNG